MSVSTLDPSTVAKLHAERLTYAEVGATGGALPQGFRHIEYTAVVGQGLASFDKLADALFSWRMHQRSGLSVRTSGPVAADVVAVLRARWGIVWVEAPCRVVRVRQSGRRTEFAYGTLPGHPETGEESFSVEIDDAELVTASIRAFSKPAKRSAKLSGPMGRRLQDRLTRNYLQSLRDSG